MILDVGQIALVKFCSTLQSTLANYDPCCQVDDRCCDVLTEQPSQHNRRVR